MDHLEGILRRLPFVPLNPILILAVDVTKVEDLDHSFKLLNTCL